MFPGVDADEFTSEGGDFHGLDVSLRDNLDEMIVGDDVLPLTVKMPR